jgi:hypothetical protein
VNDVVGPSNTKHAVVRIEIRAARAGDALGEVVGDHDALAVAVDAELGFREAGERRDRRA